MLRRAMYRSFITQKQRVHFKFFKFRQKIQGILKNDRADF